MNKQISNDWIVIILITIHASILISIKLSENNLSKQIQNINKPEIIDTKTIETKSDTSYVYYNKHIYTIRTRGDSIQIVNIR